MDISKDSRFANIKNDPKFRKIPKKERKVIIDDRFKSMFNNSKFGGKKVSIDKRGGKRLTKSDDLKKFYDLPSSESEESEEEDDDEIDKSEGSELEDEVIKKKLKDSKIDYARGEAALYSDDSSDDETEEEEVDEDEEIEHKWGELDKEAETTDEITSRLAICNMDWDRIRAVDLMVLLNSFLPPGGLILSITIYPSEFGLERMKEEEIKGPIELVDSNKSKKSKNIDDSDDDELNGNEDENEEGSEYHMEKMRQYQLNRLKYYYAVAVFDSPSTANKVYTECDGIEYESTATKLDLRFIPDDMGFNHKPKETCNKIPELNKYKPRLFTTTALQQAKVELTWDETEVERKEITQKLNSGKIDEIDESDIHAYLASGTSDEEEEDDEIEKEKSDNDDCESDGDSIDKYKALLKSVEEKEAEKQNKDVELEFTWGVGKKEKAEKIVQETLKEKMELTPFEKYKEKLKEKKKLKREKAKLKNKADDSDDDNSELSDKINEDENDDEENAQQTAELELLLAEDDNKSHFDMKKIEKSESLSKKKRLKKKQKKQLVEDDDFQVNVDDERFNAVYYSNEFNIDPADSHFRKTKGTEALIREKQKRRANEDTDITKKTKKIKNSDNKLTDNLDSLIKSVKRNTKNLSKF